MSFHNSDFLGPFGTSEVCHLEYKIYTILYLMWAIQPIIVKSINQTLSPKLIYLVVDFYTDSSRRSLYIVFTLAFFES